MQRVAIIGSPGTGKSTFARKLATKTDLPLIHLDFYFHDKNKNYYVDKEAWREKAEELSNSKTWIIDGNYSGSLLHRIEQADTIFYFNMPTYIAIKGIIYRWLKASHNKRVDMPDEWQETIKWDFFWYVLRFRHKYANGTKQLLSKDRNKTIIVFKNHKQIAQYLNSL